jgi:hypothetical protein
MPATQAQRDRWTELVADAALDVVAVTRLRMTAALNAVEGPYSPSALYHPDWFVAPMEATIVPALRAVGAQAAAQAAGEYDLRDTLEGGDWTATVSESIAAQTAILTNYGTNEVLARVAELAEQGNAGGWSKPRMAGALGLAVEWDTTVAQMAMGPAHRWVAQEHDEDDDDDGVAIWLSAGPVSDGIAENMGETEAHTVAEAGGYGLAIASALLEVKVWDTSFVNSRFSHERAHGQTVGANEEFELDAGSCQFPGDWSLPASERINCQCSVIYRFLDADEVL